jgi:ABC-type sugar transport system permease subunit
MAGTVVPTAAAPAAGAPPQRERRARRGRGSWQRRDRAIGLIATLPALVVVLGMMIYPALYAVWLSFNRSDGLNFEFVGLDNYAALFVDPLVRQVFLNNIKFLISVPIVIFVAIVVAVLLFERIRGWRFFRIVFFLPSILSAVIIGLAFKLAFGYYGWVNSVVTATGGEPIQFFTDGNLAILVIILALVWSGFGYQAVLLFSGLAAINPSIYEAAMLDGAGWWQRLWYVTLPNIRRVIGFVFIINVLYTFTALFGFVFVITAGGPGYATTTIDYLVYLRAFSGANIGSGAALAMLLFLITGVLTVLQARVFRINQND